MLLTFDVLTIKLQVLIKTVYFNFVSPKVGCTQGLKLLRALKINTRRARRARKIWGDSDTFISPMNEKRKSGPLKYCEDPQKYDIKGPNDPGQLLLILTPGCTSYILPVLENAHRLLMQNL